MTGKLHLKNPYAVTDYISQLSIDMLLVLGLLHFISVFGIHRLLFKMTLKSKSDDGVFKIALKSKFDDSVFLCRCYIVAYLPHNLVLVDYAFC